MSRGVSKNISKFQQRFTELLNQAIASGLNQQQIADGIGVSQPQVSQWKNKDQIGGENLIKAARFFKVSPEWLIGLSDEKTPLLLGEPVKYYKEIKESLEKQNMSLYELIRKHETEKIALRDTEKQQITIRESLLEQVKIQNEKLKMLGI